MQYVIFDPSGDVIKRLICIKCACLEGHSTVFLPTSFAQETYRFFEHNEKAR